MTQKFSSRAHVSLVKSRESSVEFYRLVFGITLAIVLLTLLFMGFVSNSKDPLISPPIVVITMVLPAWIGFSWAIMGYVNACLNQSEDKLGVQIAHTSA